MSREKRVALLKEIERKRKSRVVVYVTSDRRGLSAQVGADALDVLKRHVRLLAGARTKKLDLFLYSRGGDANVPWAAVGMIREYLGQRTFGVLVPFRAHSAATVIALGADDIVMTRAAELGPIDATITSGPHNPRDPNWKWFEALMSPEESKIFELISRVDSR